MRHIIRKYTLGVLSGFAVLITAGCGPSQSSSDKPVAAKIQGELIDSASSPAPKPIEPAIVATTKPLTASVAAIAQPASVPKATAPVGEYPPVGFDKLASYNFEVPDDSPVTNQAVGPDKADEQIPSTVKAFNRKKVSIKGFMLPLKVEDGVVTEFLILKDQSMCCYGNVPKITEWVSVKTTGKGVKPIMDQPVNIEGTLHVGAMRENGYLVGIYQLDGDKMIETGSN